MNKITNAIKWIFHNFFFVTLVIFFIFYLRWFKLTPFVSPGYLTNAYVGGGILMVIYGGLLIIFLLAKRTILKTVLFIIISTIFTLNSVYLFIHMPRVKFAAKCNGITYYITSIRPLSDEQWTFDMYSKWESIFKFKSFQFGVVKEIVCDEKNRETHFMNGYDIMSYSDGENPQWFYEYASTQLKDSVYLMSETSENCELPDDEGYYTCDTSVYILYKCKSDYTNCAPLPITYRTNRYDTTYDLRANEKTSEISLFEMYSQGDNETLIFTYGENSHCYVDGCTINSK
jgi:hypothetical protein